jgi:hypothetical protein
MKLKPNQSPPIVPHVLVVGDRLHPYKLPPVERQEVLYSTATQVKLSGGKSKAQRLVYCIPNNEAWIEFLEWYELLQTALDKLADNLRSLGHYPDKLKALSDNASNPLTETVICAPSPDYNHSPSWNPWDVYPNKRERKTVAKHTPQMLKLHGDRLQEYATQADHFCCPNSIAWHKFGNLQNAALFQSKCLLKFLDSLGTYKQALTDKRYKNSEHSNQVTGIKVGDRVTFTQYWNGETHQFKGIVQSLNEHPMTAVVKYETPEHLQDGVDRPNIIQSPIALFSLAKALPTSAGDTVSLSNCSAQRPEPSFDVEEPDLKSLRLPYGCVIELPTSTGDTVSLSNCSAQRPESDDDKISSEINHLRSQGTVAPAGVWVECCKITNSNFRQAYWRSREPCFTPIKGNNPEAKCKKQYIGKEGSDAHKVAIAQIERRNKINQLTKQLPKNHHEH